LGLKKRYLRLVWPLNLRQVISINSVDLVDQCVDSV
jgi:hypothetical protein